MTRLDENRRAFFEETRNLRENLYQKELELRSELAKADPDAQKAADLQTEVSNLTAQLDQKRIAHRIKMKKENPEFFAGRGYGKGGRGSHGPASAQTRPVPFAAGARRDATTARTPSPPPSIPFRHA